MKEKTADIDILEELKEWFNNFDLDSIKHKPEEYIQAISTLIAENKELKKDKEEISEEQMKQFYKDAQKALKEYRETQNKVAKLEEENKELKENYIPKSKLKAKIEEVEQWGLYNMKIPKLSTLDERLGTKIGIKYVLQSLLGKE